MLLSQYRCRYKVQKKNVNFEIKVKLLYFVLPVEVRNNGDYRAYIGKQRENPVVGYAMSQIIL